MQIHSSFPKLMFNYKEREKLLRLDNGNCILNLMSKRIIIIDFYIFFSILTFICLTFKWKLKEKRVFNSK